MKQKNCLEIISRLQANDKQAENDLLLECLPNINKFCTKFTDEYNALYDYDDAIQDCCIATLKAATKYDLTSKGNFFNYVTFWWYQAVLKNRGEMLPIHLPVDVERLYRKNKPEVLDDLRNTVQFDSLHSIDSSAGKQDRIYIYDIIKSSDMDLTAAVSYDELKQGINEALDSLTNRCKDVIIKRFGLDGNDPMTYDEIGKTIGVTRARIMQIEMKAIRQLTHRYGKYFEVFK